MTYLLFGVQNFEGTVGVPENIRTFTVTVTRSAGTTGIVGCSIATTSITAVGGGMDYNVDMGPLEFREGQNTTQFIVTIVNDAIPESEEVSVYLLEVYHMLVFLLDF